MALFNNDRLQVLINSKVVGAAPQKFSHDVPVFVVR